MDVYELAVKVREARRARKWTQEDLAAKAGVSLRMLSGFERHETTPQPENLRAITAALGIESEAGDAMAEASREEWPTDVRVFLDVMGLFLTALEDEPRRAVMHNITRQIVNR